MNKDFEGQYLDLMQRILQEGVVRDDRTGVGTIGLFGCAMRCNLSEGFPLITTKKVHFKSVLGELLWFLSGCENGIKGLKEKYGVTIWDEWQHLEEQGKVLPYVNMVRWGKDEDAINQLKAIIDEIGTNPYSRRLVISNWNPKQVHYYKNLVLPACHTFFQFYVSEGKLSCSLYCRSQDFLLGTPFNIASYALLVHMVAQVCNLEVGELVWFGGDVHLYSNHVEQAKLQLSRDTRTLPTIKLNESVKDIFSFKYNDFELIDYNPHSAISAPVAV